MANQHPAPSQPRRHIVLCSDGTGNSAAKRGDGTNVWKLFRAIDRDDPFVEQFAFYDDGVGTRGPKVVIPSVVEGIDSSYASP